jgi:cell volume regulation protein A
MGTTDQIILFGGALLVLSILASVASSRIGAPLLLVFLLLGMLFGEDGPGGIEFNDFGDAHLIATLALAIILFDGGFRTTLDAIRAAWAPAAMLATVAVIITVAVTGAATMLIFDAEPLDAMLVGAVVGSTDAAAVFLLLHQNGRELKRRVGATLEVESGANDPMAVFLTVTLVEAITSSEGGGFSLLLAESFVVQMGLGAVLGLLGAVPLSLDDDA